MRAAFIERFASVLYESDNTYIESWSDAGATDRREYLAIAAREVGALLAEHAHELAEKIRREIKDPNPLASIFQPFAGARAADLIDPEVKA